MATNEKETMTVEVPKTQELSFTYKLNKDDGEERTAKLLVDLSKLTGEQIMEWAYSAMVVSYQGKLRGKKAPEADKETGVYKWEVPARGTRLAVDPATVAKKAEELLDKLTPAMKYDLMIKMGAPAAMASAATGFTPPALKK